MGCVFSRKDINDIHPRIFRASNIDDQGMELSPGKIEVSDSELILHQKGKEPIRWPWRCLRRYGFDEELFSFESGRRCPSGQGIYAFRCKRAERLFLLVQECIQRVGQEDQAHVSQRVISAATRMYSRPVSTVDSQDSNGFAHQPSAQPISSTNPMAHLYVNGPAAYEDSEPVPVNYANVTPNTVTNSRDAPERINYAELELPTSTENLSNEGQDQDDENIGESDLCLEGLPLTSANDTDVFVDDPVHPEYANITNKINYIQLDLNQSSEHVSNGVASGFSACNTNTPDSPSKKTAERESYVTIDFHKTTALHNFGKGTVEEEEGTRKTRHSSTISELN